MTKQTLAIATVLLALGATAFGQTQDEGLPGLPETQAVPGPHGDVMAFYRNEENDAQNGKGSLPDDVAMINGTSPVAHSYNQAIDEYKAGKLDSAAKDLQAVLKQEPENVPAHKLLAYTLLRQNKISDALPHLESTVKTDPKDVQTRDNLGKVYLQLKRPADAATQFRAVLATSPKDATAAQGLAQTQVKTAAATTAETVIAKEGQKPEKSDLSAQDYMKQGADLLKANKFDDAMAAYNKAADLDPQNADLRLYIGEQYARAGKTDPALSAINQALAMKTKHIFEAYTLLGQLHAPTDPARAVTEFKIASDARPADPGTWYNLGVLEAQVGDTAAAKQDYQKVLDLKPADAALANEARQNLAALAPPAKEAK